jgi:hypothetical protein
MGSYPVTPRSAFIAWCQAHVQTFLDNDSQIGLTEAEAVAFEAAVNNAAAAALAQEQARQAAQSATEAASQKLAALRRVTRVTVDTIKTFAQSTNNPNVYVLADLPAPGQATPVPPPGRPFDLQVALDATDGTLVLRWKANNPRGASGTSYIIRRRLPGQGPFEFVGVTGSKKFFDTEFESGPDSVEYTVQGQRSGLSGPVSAIFVVNFGRPGLTGQRSISVTEMGIGQDQSRPNKRAA